MEIQENNQTTQSPKRKYWKFVIGFFGIIIGVFILYTAGFWAVYYYKQWQGQKAVQKLAEALKQAEQEDYERAMADTYGGKTPQETLQMYIDAVEKGNYELASKYFIGDKQKKELNKLNNTNENEKDLGIYLEFVKTAKPWRSSLEDKNFVMEAKTNLGSSIFIRFIKYPNGIWKIIEI